MSLGPVAPAAPRDAQAAPSAAALYREHYEFVWRNARRLGCDDDWVDDAVHEVFLVAARRVGEFEYRANVRTWLFAITLRVVARLRRNRKRYQLRLSEYAEAQAEATVESPEAQNASARYLRSLLSELDEKHRAVVILVELEGMTGAEVAEALGVKEGTVASRLRAARQRLAQRIERDRVDFERQAR
ncbi:MAG TPA: sigma-70 family RNA polymerase sigma factor [Polyangiaceae bacterium]|nr:sigma-70 family RNA polymerase sigma factor [Polyangiaceae bacterium]